MHHVAHNLIFIVDKPVTSDKAPPKRIHVGSASIERGKYEGTYGEIIKSADAYASRALDDSFSSLYNSRDSFQILTPPYPPEQLIKLPQLNNTLGQCVEAMVTNCDGFGHTLQPMTQEAKDLNEEALAEKERIEELISQPFDDQTFLDIRKKSRADYETIGWKCLEIGRDATGAIIWFRHIPSHTVRKTRLDVKPIEVTVSLRRKSKLVSVKTTKRFRRYVQRVGAKRLYFKEYGDPRVIDPSTGKENKSLNVDSAATEILWREIYTVGENYGTPRYINNIPSVLGSREAEMVNFHFFEDNAIPALAVLLAGGQLTEDTVSDIRKMFQKKGKDTMHKVLVLEAKADNDNAGMDGKAPIPSLSIQPLAKDRQSDGLFKDYLEQCHVNIRSSFRLPPILLGRSEEHSHATAAASMETVKSQVILPEQQEFDAMMNEKILVDENGHPPKHWKFVSNPPTLADADTQVKAFEQAGKLGGITINDAIAMANTWLHTNNPLIKEEWGNWPIELVREAIQQGKIKPPIPNQDQSDED